jgi:hypothetical protein
MVSHRLIECDCSCVIAQKSYGFRVPNPFQPTRKVRCTNPSILRQLAKSRRQRERPLRPVDVWLKAHFLTLDFDADAARNVIETMVPHVGSTLALESYRGLIRELVDRFACDVPR